MTELNIIVALPKCSKPAQSSKLPTNGAPLQPSTGFAIGCPSTHDDIAVKNCSLQHTS